MSSSQPPDLVLQVFPATLGSGRLRRYGLRFGVSKGIDDDRREDLLKAADNVSFNDLCGYIGYERLQRDLNGKLAYEPKSRGKRLQCESIRNRAWRLKGIKIQNIRTAIK
jgi:hypothetical protein